MARVRDIIDVVDRLAPFGLAEAWDHVGLQVGSAGDAAGCVLEALELDDASLDEAARLGCEVVLTHHPLIHAPVERLTDADGSGRLALRAARERRAVIAAHTNLDKAHGGVAEIVADMLGLEETAPLAPATADMMKLVGFVPADDVDLVRTALFAVGAGVIGEYEHCSWSVPGEGTFFGREGTDPSFGRAGRDERVPEIRLELTFPRRLRRRVVATFVGAHPYEEPAFDIYPVENEVASLGLGRLGLLPEAVPLAAFAAEVAAVLHLPSIRYAGDGARPIRRVACLPGSGAEAIARGVADVADVLVTGDVKYHEARAALAHNLAIVDAPHDITEEEALLRWSEKLVEALVPLGVRVETYRRPARVWEVYDASGSASHPTSTIEPAFARGGSGAARASAAEEPPAQLPLSPEERLSEVLAHRNDNRHHLYTDGGSRGNPGPAGIGAVLMSPSGDIVDEVADYIGTATNNVAEYQALLAGLELALDRDVKRLDVFLDSELVVRQLLGQYKVKEPALRALHAQAVHLMHQFHEIDVQHVPREQNSVADALVNRALDEARD